MSFSESEKKKILPSSLFTCTILSERTLIVTRTFKPMLWIVLNYVLWLLDVHAFIGCLMSVVFIGSVKCLSKRGLHIDNVHRGCYGRKQLDYAYSVFSRRSE
uniref:Uncharacterized protein n=1 Tax=Lactuca sativa TaxID=4236 RepID=A0A9R1X4S5_LACSA|nr:hypothetical protein LSAT_V11C600336950 [Lactuca sativa]